MIVILGFNGHEIEELIFCYSSIFLVVKKEEECCFLGAILIIW